MGAALPKLFLSYGRGDDEPFVKKLYQRLDAEGFSVWWDRECMPSRALTFLKEIREAVRASDRVVVVIGPSCVRSAYCRAEWQAALAESKVVNPILRLGDHTLLPPELGNFHCPDLRHDALYEERIREVLRILTEPIPMLGELFGGVPDVPPHFQPRPDDLSRLVSEVLIDETRPVTLTGPGRVTVLHGMGGGGKSVLAAAFARSTSTRRSFRDGVFWINAGEAAEPQSLIAQLARGFGATDIVKALAERNVLLVVDSAWRVDQVEPIVDALGASCRLLITTRVRELATSIGGTSVELGELSVQAGLQHLADWAGVSPADLPEDARQVAHECGYLPFALALNGAMHEQGVSWSDLLGALHNAQIDYAEQRFKSYPYPTVLKSISVSMSALEVEEPLAVKRLTELAAFHTEAGIPEKAVVALWGQTGSLGSNLASKTLTKLAGRSLIRLDGEGGRRRILIHDLQLDYLLCIADRAGLNRLLVAAYEKACAGRWSEVPADGYIHEHLVRHLLADGRQREIAALLVSDTPTGSNAWHAASEAVDNITGYLADLDRVSATTEDEAEVLRLALMRTSVEDSLTRVPVAVNVLLLTGGKTSSATALTAAMRIADPERRVAALLELVPKIPEGDRREILNACLNTVRTRGNQVQARYLPQIAMQFTGEEQQSLVREGLAAARTISVDDIRAARLGKLLPLVPAELKPEVATQAADALNSSVKSGSSREAVRAVLPHMPELASQLLNPARAIGEPFLQAMAFESIVPFLPQDARDDAAREGIAYFEQSGAMGLWIVISLARHIPAYDMRALIQRAVSTDTRQVPALIDALPNLLEGSALGAALEDIAAYAEGFEEPTRTETLISLLPHRDSAGVRAEVERLLRGIRELSYDTWQRDAYLKMLGYLDRDQLLDVRKKLSVINDGPQVLAAAAELARDADASLRRDLLTRVLALPDSREKFVALVALARDEGARDAAYGMRDAIQQWQRMSSPAMALASLMNIPQQRDNVLEAAWKSALAMPGFAGEQELVELAPMLPEIARVTGFRALLRNSEQLSAHRQQYWSGGARISDNSSAVADTLERIATSLPGALLTEAQEVVHRMTNDAWRCIALCHLVPVLDGHARESSSQELSRLIECDALMVDSESDEQLVASICRALPRVLTSGVPNVQPFRDCLRTALALVDASYIPGLINAASGAMTVEEVQALAERALARSNIFTSVRVAPFRPTEDRWTVFKEAMQYTETAADAVKALLGAPKEVRVQAWKQGLASAGKNRAEVANQLAVAAPLAVSIDKTALLNSAARSLMKVQAWWS